MSAKYELKLLCYNERGAYVRAFVESDYVCIEMSSEGVESSIYLDKATAIKFSKAIRTEINKIQD